MSLGEGLYVDHSAEQVYWVDINKSRIFQKCLTGGATAEYYLANHPSVILGRQGLELLLCDSSGIVAFDLASSETRSISLNPDSGMNSQFRSNDGVLLDGGMAIYGTMEHKPRDMSGAIYVFDGITTRSLDIRVGIPNAFIPIDESSILIADSLTKQVNLYKVNIDERSIKFVRCWHDFSSTPFTPDGGCSDYDGRVYLALWDGSGVAVLNTSGKLIEIIELPVPRPTNCKLTGDGNMLVTTAREGLSREEIQAAPLSGSVLVVQLG